jgi:hypothetical protein
VIVAVTPTGEAAAHDFRELFNYFYSKKRYGVLGNKGIANVRDTYLVPIPASPESLPEFIMNLEGHKLKEDRLEPMILVTLVIRNEIQPVDFARGFDGPNETQSPSTIGHPQRQMSMGGNTRPAISPIAPQGGSQSPAGLQPVPGSDEAQRRYMQEEQRRADQKRGEAVAAEILGSFITAPTVHFLMPQAFQMRLVEWEVIKDIFQNDAKAQHDLAYLSQLLEQRRPAES